MFNVLLGADTLNSTARTLLYCALGILGALAIVVAVYFIVRNYKAKQPRENVKRTPKQTAFKSLIYLLHVSLFSAIAVVLLYLEFPLFPAVAHLKMNFSDAPCLLAAFMYGPVTGVLVNFVKVGVCLLLRGTSTGFVGDLSNLISGTLYAFAAGGIYLLRRTKGGAVLSLGVSSAIFCVAMWFCNQWFLLPFFGITEHAEMMPMLWWTLLFNVIKTVLTSLITFFVYKPLSRALHWDFGKKQKVAVPATDGANAPVVTATDGANAQLSSVGGDTSDLCAHNDDGTGAQSGDDGGCDIYNAAPSDSADDSRRI